MAKQKKSFLQQFIEPVQSAWTGAGEVGKTIQTVLQHADPLAAFMASPKKGSKPASKTAAPTTSTTSASGAAAPGSDSALLNLLQQSGLYDTGQMKQQDWITHHPLASAYAQQHGINLLNQGAGQSVDPLSQQLFFFSTIAPYLNQIKSQTESLTGPLYAKAASQLSHLPGQYQSLAPFLSMMQAGDSNLQTALAGSAAAAPSLDALMSNVSAERQAQQKAYYEALLAKTAGGAGGTAGNPFGLNLPST